MTYSTALSHRRTPMRRLTAALLAPLAVTAALAGCSSSPTTTSTNQSVKVTGAEGKAPTVHIPAQKAGSSLVTKTLVTGHGQKVTSGDSYLPTVDVFRWRGKPNEMLFPCSTRTQQVIPVPIGLPRLQKAATGQ